MYPNKFNYVLMKDAGVTGNLEVHVGRKSSDRSNMKLVHTKRKGQGHPSEDWEVFHSRLEVAMA